MLPCSSITPSIWPRCSAKTDALYGKRLAVFTLPWPVATTLARKTRHFLAFRGPLAASAFGPTLTNQRGTPLHYDA